MCAAYLTSCVPSCSCWRVMTIIVDALQTSAARPAQPRYQGNSNLFPPPHRTMMSSRLVEKGAALFPARACRALCTVTDKPHVREIVQATYHCALHSQDHSIAATYMTFALDAKHVQSGALQGSCPQ